MIQLASIMHDLKVPLSCVKVAKNVIRASIKNEKDKLKKCFRNIDVSISFLFNMIEDLQDLAKYATGHI